VSTPLPDRVREACAWVAARARFARVEEGAIGGYAQTLPAALDHGDPDPATNLVEGDRETRAAFTICLDAINFGSGWWPTIHKRPGLSGYSTVAAGVVDRFRDPGPWTAAELVELTAADLDRAGVAAFSDLDGVLRLDPELARAIDAGELLVHGSPQEVELRAGAVHAIELLAAAHGRLTPAEIDAALWNRGREPRYKAVPRPRCRNTAY
jgi:hypothetical protein